MHKDERPILRTEDIRRIIAEARTEQLGAGETPLGKAEVKLDYRQARSQLRAALQSVNGGALTLDARADLDLSFPALLDRDAAVSRRYLARALPSSFLVDREGVVQYVKVGPLTNAILAEQVERLLR